jgi:hypothetical protein
MVFRVPGRFLCSTVLHSDLVSRHYGMSGQVNIV